MTLPESPVVRSGFSVVPLVAYFSCALRRDCEFCRCTGLDRHIFWLGQNGKLRGYGYGDGRGFGLHALSGFVGNDAPHLHPVPCGVSLGGGGSRGMLLPQSSRFCAGLPVIPLIFQFAGALRRDSECGFFPCVYGNACRLSENRKRLPEGYHSRVGGNGISRRICDFAENLHQVPCGVSLGGGCRGGVCFPDRPVFRACLAVVPLVFQPLAGSLDRECRGFALADGDADRLFRDGERSRNDGLVRRGGFRGLGCFGEPGRLRLFGQNNFLSVLCGVCFCKFRGGRNDMRRRKRKREYHRGQSSFMLPDR